MTIISLNKSSIDFFKKKAKEQRTSYQKMIRRLIDWYASQQQKSAYQITLADRKVPAAGFQAFAQYDFRKE